MSKSTGEAQPVGSQPNSSGPKLLRSLTAATHEQPWSNPLIALLALGVGALVALGWTRTNKTESIAIALLVGGAAFTSGAILGFVFGIPRAVQQARSNDPSSGEWESAYQVNTNLEQISDWLTKIIVGVGLVGLATIPAKFRNLAEYMASAFGSPAVPSGVAAVILTYFAVTGFLGAYLWTRIFLSLEFTRADRAGRQSPAFYEGLVEALLYQPAPDGFEAAIRNGEEFIRRFGQGNWRIWRSLACAWGQKYSYLMFQEPRNEIEMSRTRQQALDAVRRIININPGEREGIRSLWDPSLATPEENDLKVFASDKEFRSLLVPSEDESRTGDMAENKT